MTRDACQVIALRGRLDSFAAKIWQAFLEKNPPQFEQGIVLDLAEVNYISSAGIRILLGLHKLALARGAVLALANLQPYCQSVLEIAGMAAGWPSFGSLENALAHCRETFQENNLLARWAALETAELACGQVRIIPGSNDSGEIRVLGHIQNVLKACITREDIRSKRFSHTEYSLGLGGLGDRIDDYFTIMGEMITVGGTMVWLPTDGNDTPDFLIPSRDRGEVMIRTGFNASIGGQFNEYFVFESAEPRGTTMSRLYRELFNLSQSRRSDFHGVLGFAARCEFGEVYGAGVRKATVADFAPANGELITHPSNYAEWFEFDREPRLRNVTGLISGLGADLAHGLNFYDPAQLGACFYLNPANAGTATEMLHNHGVFFSPLPLAERPVSLEKEIRSVVDRGDFVDMRHLLDSSTIRRGILGISYIQEFKPDSEGVAAEPRR